MYLDFLFFPVSWISTPSLFQCYQNLCTFSQVGLLKPFLLLWATKKCYQLSWALHWKHSWTTDFLIILCDQYCLMYIAHFFVKEQAFLNFYMIYTENPSVYYIGMSNALHFLLRGPKFIIVVNCICYLPFKALILLTLHLANIW